MQGGFVGAVPPWPPGVWWEEIWKYRGMFRGRTALVPLLFFVGVGYVERIQKQDCTLAIVRADGSGFEF